MVLYLAADTHSSYVHPWHTWIYQLDVGMEFTVERAETLAGDKATKSAVILHWSSNALTD